MNKEFRIYSTVTGDFDFVSIIDLLTSDNSRISRKMVEDDFTVEQFTGLKDCEGIKIYEGDIIEDEEHYYSVISWDNDDSMYVASDVGGIADMNFPIKVIGNIHQNPELLED